MAKGLKGEEEEARYKKVADLLLLLSCGEDDDERKLAVAGAAGKKKKTGGSGAFECKTCSRRFPTFQALGGHRTSHGRVQQSVAGGQIRAPKKPKMLRQQHHKCSVCGLAFHMGQALGGHMRRHKLAEAAAGNRPETKKAPWLDLNLPPMEIDLQLGVL